MKNPSPLILKYLAAYQKDPRSTIFAALAESYRQAGMTDQAIQVLKQGLRSHPEYTLAHITLTKCYMDLNKDDLAYSALYPFALKERDNLSLQSLFATLCERLEYYQEALETYKFLLFLNPKNEEWSAKVNQLETDLQEPLFTPHGITQPPPDAEEWSMLPLDRSSPIEITEDCSEVDLASDEELEELPVLRSEQMTDSPSEEFDPPYMTLTLVDLYIEQGHLDHAKNLLQKILELDPNHHEAQKKLDNLNQLSVAEFEETVPTVQEQLSTVQDNYHKQYYRLEQSYQHYLNKVKEHLMRSRS